MILEIAQGIFATAGAADTLTGSIFKLTAAMMSNPLFATVAVGAGLFVLYKIIDNFSISVKEASQALDESYGSFKVLEEECKSLESELETAAQRMQELNNMDSLSLIEQEELDNLKEATTELEKQLLIKQNEKRIEARKTFESASELYDTQVLDKYDKDGKINVASQRNNVGEDRATELQDTIQAYQYYNEEYEKELKEWTYFSEEAEKVQNSPTMYDNLKKQADFHKKQMDQNQKWRDDAKQHADEIGKTANDLENAYKGMSDAGENFDTADLTKYEEVQKIATAYSDFLVNVVGIQKKFEELSPKDKRSRLEQELALKGKTLNDAQNIISNFKDEDLDLIATLKLDKETSIESIKQGLADIKKNTEVDIQKAWTKGDMIDHLTTLGDGFKAIQDVFEDVENGKGFDWTKLDSSKFTKAFEGMDNEVAEFRETIAGSPNDINKCREAFNKLVTSYIQNKVALGEINEGNAKVTADYLKMYGITNAEAIVEHELADTRLDLALSNQSLEEGYENLIDESGNLVDACSKETNGFIDVKYEAGEMTKALASAMLKKMAFADNPINVTDDINNLVRLAKTAGFTGDSLMRIEEIKAKYNKGLQYQDTKLMQEAATEWNNFYSTFEDNLADYIYEPVDYTSPKDGSKGSSKDTWLEEYKDKLKILQDQLAMQEITEKEYYDGAEQLMFHYLMSSEERLKKYEKEIADAQKDLHDSWIKAYEEGKTELDNQLSKGLITQIQYLKQLATLGDQYFGILGTGGIKPVTELPDELQEWVARYEEINQQCLEYSANLDDIYKKYGNINNMDRQIIYWDDATLEKWAKQIEDWNWNWDGQLKDTWTTVLGDSQNFNGLEIAFSAILNTDKGAVPLTKDEFDKYINQVINTASKNGGYNAENVLKFDAQGFDMMVNGSMQHVSNMIAAVEGQIVNGAKLTANDVLAISGVTSKEMGYNLNSAFEGKSMHVIQEKVLEAKKEYEQLAKEAKNAGYNIEEYIGEYGSEAVQKYGYYVKEVAEKTKELAEGLKDAMDKSIQAIMSLIDTQISKLEKAEKKQKRPLEQAKKELEKQSREYNKLIKGLDKQIKVIDKEIDKLDEANEKRSQELKLMKAKYELQRAENQKNQLVKNMPEYTVMYIEKVTISVKG